MAITRKRRASKPKEEEDDVAAVDPSSSEERKAKRPTKKKKKSGVDGGDEIKNQKVEEAEEEEEDSECRLIGEPVEAVEALRRWPKRYEKQKVADCLYARRHYEKAEVDGCIYNLYDDAFMKAEEGKPDYIGRIIEFFEATNKNPYVKVQWFYRPEDTVINSFGNLIEDKRVFLSDVMDDNPLGCIISKINIVKVEPNIDLVSKRAKIPPSDFYYDMVYSPKFSSFSVPSTVENERDGETSTISCEGTLEGMLSEKNRDEEESSKVSSSDMPEMTLLDLYSGCGAMSTGLCLGATLCGVNLVTKWAVDFNEYACQSLEFNHPETKVRNEDAENFLILLKKWEQLCDKFSLLGTTRVKPATSIEAKMEDDEEVDIASTVSSEEFEVENFVGICYGDPKQIKRKNLYFKVHWKGYGPEEDTWEPLDGLGKCEEKLKDFVTTGYNSSILPLPGDVDVVCGGPPCQGISGFNRFRNLDEPLKDPKNHQLEVFMDIVDFLKPKYVLMENVNDILKFADGLLGRYALGRLVAMNYQARLGMLVAGSYGLPQFRSRAFFWGAHPSEKLPQYPLPTHEVKSRGNFPTEFETNVVAYEQGKPHKLEKALLLEDAISDLPPVTNYETRDDMLYVDAARTEFQRHIRLCKNEMISSNIISLEESQQAAIHDHRPLQLNEDDYQRVCRIPKKKGANFRDLPGVLVDSKNKVYFDSSMDRVYLPSGKPLVPAYAMTYVKGISVKPFGRLWWDSVIGTVVTRAEPHNQVIIHPEQDRVLTVRENARLQGFPDYYKLFGPIKERYIQVGNAVAVPVARALGYALGLASQRKSEDSPLLTLPQNFPNSLRRIPSATILDNEAN